MTNLSRRLDDLEHKAQRASLHKRDPPTAGELAELLSAAFAALDAGELAGDPYHERGIATLREALEVMPWRH